MQPKIPEETFLEKRKKELRSQFSVRAPKPEDFQRQEDVRWARQDPEVLTLYCGELVVPYGRQIVAHGADAAAVRAEASRVTGRPVEELVLVSIIDPLMDLAR